MDPIQNASTVISFPLEGNYNITYRFTISTINYILNYSMPVLQNLSRYSMPELLPTVHIYTT
jgi:hypothetical protein